VLPADIRLALAPDDTYRQLAAHAAPARWSAALARPALALLVLAIVLPITAVHVVTARLVVDSAAACSWVVLIQLALAALTIAPAPRRRVGLRRAFDLWFAGHLPYTVWLLAMPLLSLSREGAINLGLVTFVVAVIWSTEIETSFCRVVLGDTPDAARARIAVHQAVMLTIVAAVVLWAAGGFAAVTSYVARMLARFV
jgi:hypothetical protein